jgi:hypothetical protein
MLLIIKREVRKVCDRCHDKQARIVRGEVCEGCRRNSRISDPCDVLVADYRRWLDAYQSRLRRSA